MTETDLASLSLNQFLDKSVGEAVGGQFIRWVNNHGRAGKTDGLGNGFCPMCLANDPVPYFRLSWRLAFVTHCPVHRCQLLQSCPCCQRRCWPETYANRHKFRAHWVDLRHCPECGFNLGTSAPALDGKGETSSILWKRINSNLNSDLSETAIPTNDYFRALWTICRLLSRQIKRFISIQSLENLQPILSSHIAGRTIEKQSSEVREALVSSAMWLLENWPDRFVSTCSEAKISRMDFGAADNCSPGWVDSVVRFYFARNVNWITREDVSDAIGQLETKGLKVSKNALRRKLGVSESQAINEILDQRREGTIEELSRLCEHYRVLISHTPPSRDQQRTLCRDFLILLLTAFSGDPIETICEMNQFSVDALISSTRNYSRRNLGGLVIPPEISGG